MNVLFVTLGDFSNASVKQAYWFGEQLVSAGHRVMLTVAGDPHSLDRENLAPLDGLEVMYHRFAGRRLGREAKERVIKFAPTVIHAWNPQVPQVVAARIYRRVTGAPVFVRWEDDDWTMRKGIPGRPLYRVIGFKARRAMGYVVPMLGAGASNAVEIAWMKREAAGFDALTPTLAAEVESRLGRPCSVVLPVISESAASTGPELGLEIPIPTAGKTVVTYTGAIGPASIHDLQIALEALATLQREHRNVVLVHAGHVAPRYRTDAMARRAGVQPDTVAYLGYIPFEQIPGLLAKSDILIQPGGPTRFNRLRLPSKLQAYLTSATPTITFAAGFGEMLEDRNEVLKVHTDSPEELASAIAEIIDSPELAARLGAGAAQAARRLFGPRENTAALVSYYLDRLASAA